MIPQRKDTAGTTPFLGGCDKPKFGIFKNWEFIIFAPHKRDGLWGCGCMSLCIPRVFLVEKGSGAVFVFLRDVEGVCDSVHPGSRWETAFTLPSEVRNI